MRSWTVVVSLSLFLAGAAGFKSARIPIPEPVPQEKADLTEEHIFNQLIDHNNPELGTFPQRYWYNAEWWKGEGSPVGLRMDITATWLMERLCSSPPAKQRRRGTPHTSPITQRLGFLGRRQMAPWCFLSVSITACMGAGTDQCLI